MQDPVTVWLLCCGLLYGCGSVMSGGRNPAERCGLALQPPGRTGLPSGYILLPQEATGMFRRHSLLRAPT